MDNATIAARLEALAALLELAGANPYTARAYRRAGELVRGTPLPVADLVRAGRARELRGIGPGIERRLVELVETGRIAELEELERDLDPELVALGRYLGLGPRKLLDIGRALGVRSLPELREAVAAGRLPEVHGVGPETERRVREALEREPPRAAPRPMLLPRAQRLCAELAEALGGVAAGDPRRWRDACERLAVVVAAQDPEPVLRRFAELLQVVAVVERTERTALGVTVEGVPVELFVPAPAQAGTALVRATGSAAYVAALEPLPEGATEEEVYRRLGLAVVPPELREAPFRGEPPALVELAQIRGDLHAHTTWSDGKASALEMGLGARERGYAYLAICDHTPAVGAVPGLDGEALRRQGEEIAAANEELAPFRLLRGVECDILRDGGLDAPDDVLAELDWVQLSLHAGQRAPQEELTRRVVEAMRHPAVRCLSHPKGRIVNHRPENALDLDAVFATCLETGVALEVNGLPDRLDLRGEHVREAIRAGVRIVCSTDSHSTRGLGNMELAVRTARRGFATAPDVLNTLPLAELLTGKTQDHSSRRSARQY
jgi:DNA polymerase (family 10)